MAKRRKKRKISTALSEHRADDLIGGMAGLLSGLPTGEQLYDSDLQRRAVYFANKEKLIDLCLEDYGPGRRPDAFWEYEGPEGINNQDRFPDVRCFEYLIDNNLLQKGELEGMQAEYLLILEPYKTGLASAGREHVLFEKFDTTAKILGGAALEAWTKFIKDMENKQ
jgi:hypothetical protein